MTHTGTSTAGTSTTAVLAAVAAERQRAETLFPGQHLSDGTPQDADRIGLTKAMDLAERTRDMFRRVCRDKTTHGRVTWWDVVREELYEAGAETDPAALRAELIQTAATIVRWVEDIDARTGGAPR